MSVVVETSDSAYNKRLSHRGKVEIFGPGPVYKNGKLDKPLIKTCCQKADSKPERLRRIGFYAIGIIKKNSAYEAGFLKIIPKELISWRVCSQYCEELDDAFSDFLQKDESKIKEHSKAEQLREFLKALRNVVYYAR
jgi:hypothetical protein